MSDAPVRGVVFTHGDVAGALVASVRQISGCPEEALTALSNQEGSPAVLQGLLRSLVAEGPTIVFADLRASSCATVAQLCRRAEELDMAVVVGVNLPMLLDFVFHRDRAIADLVPRLLESAREGIEALER